MDIEVYDLYKRTYKCDERESIRFAPMISKIYLDSVKKQRDQYKNERDTLIDDVAILKANNERLMRRNQKLEGYVRMWEKLTKWKKGKLEEYNSNDLLHELSYTMNELERDMYKGRS